MDNIKEYDMFVNEFRTYNVLLTEADYEELLKTGRVYIESGYAGQDAFVLTYEPTIKDNKNGTIRLSEYEFEELSTGEIIDKGTIKLALQDIGFDRIFALRKKYKK